MNHDMIETQKGDYERQIHEDIQNKNRSYCYIWLALRVIGIVRLFY